MTAIDPGGGHDGDPGLDPRPIGWFAIAASHELGRGKAVDGVLATAPYRLRRRRDGGLELDGLPGPVAEQNGLILAWHHPAGDAPSWRIPVLDDHGWRPLRHRRLRARSHPQEVYENSIDTGHFPVVHGYHDIAVLQPMRFAGHEMSVRYRIGRRMPVAVPGLGRSMGAEFEVRLHGIGCAHNHIRVPALGLHTRMLAMATPTEAGQVDIRLAVTVAAGSAIPGFLLPLVQLGVARSINHDFEQDIAVWEHKRYLRPPMLVKGDGPIEAFRRWSRQFSADDRGAGLGRSSQPSMELPS